MWFEDLVGFREESPQQVRENLVLEGELLTSRVNGRAMVCGRLETPALGELRDRVQAGRHTVGSLSVREVVANAQSLHADEALAGALFQVASQFNLLEMASPSLTPEHGVGIYEKDHTQGPACAIAAGAGTIFRNYFAMAKGETGQTARNQIDCLADMGQALGNAGEGLWEMRNGYALPSQEGLRQISNRLRASSATEMDEFRKLLRIGVQWNTQVTIEKSTHAVSQAYCSALPIAYSRHALPDWEGFARLVLEAAYEATMCAGILNFLGKGNHRVFLTLVGGGAFGNPEDWIIEAIERALILYEDFDIDVGIVSYGVSRQSVRELVDRFSN